MSKSLGNYVALEDVPSDMFGKIMSISDDLMIRYYELLTTENLSDIKRTHPMEAKQRLARLVVERYHGERRHVRRARASQQSSRIEAFRANRICDSH